ncbi:hypothetical protein DFH06DRAFT_1308585 [Mycena polygramma]|nr:hypothetical protein DFH06DRAFT_1308585 [Mycena polygramma]
MARPRIERGLPLKIFWNGMISGCIPYASGPLLASAYYGCTIIDMNVRLGSVTHNSLTYKRRVKTISTLDAHNLGPVWLHYLLALHPLLLRTTDAPWALAFELDLLTSFGNRGSSFLQRPVHFSFSDAISAPIPASLYRLWIKRRTLRSSASRCLESFPGQSLDSLYPVLAFSSATYVFGAALIMSSLNRDCLRIPLYPALLRPTPDALEHGNTTARLPLECTHNPCIGFNQVPVGSPFDSGAGRSSDRTPLLGHTHRVTGTSAEGPLAYGMRPRSLCGFIRNFGWEPRSVRGWAVHGTRGFLLSFSAASL